MRLTIALSILVLNLGARTSNAQSNGNDLTPESVRAQLQQLEPTFKEFPKKWKDPVFRANFKSCKMRLDKFTALIENIVLYYKGSFNDDQNFKRWLLLNGYSIEGFQNAPDKFCVGHLKYSKEATTQFFQTDYKFVKYLDSQKPLEERYAQQIPNHPPTTFLNKILKAKNPSYEQDKLRYHNNQGQFAPSVETGNGRMINAVSFSRGAVEWKTIKMGMTVRDFVYKNLYSKSSEITWYNYDTNAWSVRHRIGGKEFIYRFRELEYRVQVEGISDGKRELPTGQMMNYMIKVSE